MDNLYVDKIYIKNNNFILDVEKLTIFKNKVNLIYGENGAGKTTLLNAIVEKKDIFPNYKKVLLTQSSYTFNRSCVKNLEMVLKWNQSKIEPLELLDLVGLLDKKDYKGKLLSGGEKKRLAFAMILATDADVILLDEPFANVDLKSQEKLISVINKLANKKTIVLVSHRLDICKEFVDYTIYLENGKIIKR